MDITKHPPCTPKCPSRGMGCHSGCEAYAAWKRQMTELSAERRKKQAGEADADGMSRERKDWLRRRGWPIKGGAT